MASQNGNGSVKESLEQSRRRITIKEADEVLHNALMERINWLRRSEAGGDNVRDIDKECHYPSIVTVEMCRDMYDRFSIATRVNDIYPEECWQILPDVYEDADMETETEFEKAWKALDEEFGGFCYFRRRQGPFNLELPGTLRQGQRVGYVRAVVAWGR